MIGSSTTQYEPENTVAAAREYLIKIVAIGSEEQMISGKGKANKEKQLRELCTQVAQSTGGEVWVTETNAKAWQVWNCPKGGRFGYRGRVVQK